MVSLCAGICSPSVGRGRRREVDADPQATSPAPSKAAANLTLGEAAGFKSERWPLSNRNGGRLQIGTAAAFKSEKAAAFSWNLQLRQDVVPDCGRHMCVLENIPHRSD